MKIKDIAKKYLEGDFSLDYLANKYGFTRETLRRRFAKLGVERKSNYRKIRLPHKDKFQIGHTPWNKNLKYDEELKAKLNTTGLEIGHQKDENNHNWRGEFASYSALHYWIYRRLGKASYCTFNKNHKSTRYHWANISRQYKRDITDFMSLCPSCHYYYDKKGGEI